MASIGNPQVAFSQNLQISKILYIVYLPVLSRRNDKTAGEIPAACQ